MSDENRPLEDNPMAKYLKKPGKVSPVISIIRGVLGAIAGGTIGHFTFMWLKQQHGFYSLVLPGALLGLGFGLASQYRSWACGFACAVAAFFLGCYSEWCFGFGPFKADDSYFYFVTHVFNVDSSMTIFMLVLGVILAFWFGRGR